MVTRERERKITKERARERESGKRQRVRALEELSNGKAQMKC